MRITSFNPLVMTTDQESIVKLFEGLGFERQHEKDGMECREDIDGIRMKDANGFCVDVVKSDRIKQDMVSIRMNVDDFDSAKEELEKQGFKALSAETVNDTSSKSIGMMSPSGLVIGLVEHIKG